jgi:hypothetical protein
MSEILGIPDNIPSDLLQKAECVIVLPSVLKFAFGFGGSYGRGDTGRPHRRLAGALGGRLVSREGILRRDGEPSLDEWAIRNRYENNPISILSPSCTHHNAATGWLQHDSSIFHVHLAPTL